MPSALDSVELATFHKYAGLALPRHVAYPMPTWWADFTAAEGAELLRASRARPAAADLSLYVHVPFCERACRYCACTRVVQPRDCAGADERTRAYVAALEAELERVAAILGPGQRVRQVHWGGGTPTYLPAAEIARVQRRIGRCFEIAGDAEVAMELDPRVTTRATLGALRELGFNRVSLGIQDFDARVQAHVARIQPVELVQEMVGWCRELGFASINFDLIYGLPYQTVDSVRATLAQTVALGPDRIAYYQYAQIPDKVAAQRGLDYEQLPDSTAKLEMYLLGQEVLPQAGYEFIGLDHFARPTEPLARALRAGTLQRNFQGMTTGGGLDLVGLGASSIGQLRGLGYLQNRRGVDEYIGAVRAGALPVYRGKRFSDDDRVRQEVLRQIYCHAEIDSAAVEAEMSTPFEEYFARELRACRTLAEDGLLEFRADGRIVLTDPLGRVLMRTVGAVFDAYLEPDAWQVGDRQYFSANA